MARTVFIRLLAMLLIAGVSSGAAGQSGGETDDWPGLSGPQSFTFASNRLNFPVGAMPAANPISGLGQVFNNAPPYPISNLRFLFVNFYVATDGTPNPERKPGGDNTIDFATVFIDGKAFPLTFDGATRVVLEDGGLRWSDPLKDDHGRPFTLPANASYFVRTSRSAPAGGRLVVGSGNFGVQPRFTHALLGDGVEYTDAPQAAKRLAGSVAAYRMGSAPVAPAMAIGAGWDGSPVYLVVGDSIGVGQADYDFGDRGVVGYIERGLDDDSRSKRRNFATMTISGTRPDDQSSSVPGQYELRMKALRSIPNRPFNAIISEMGQNSLSIAGSSLWLFERIETSWWQYWRDACPACRIYQTTFPSHAGSANNAGWTNAADQTTDYPGGMRWKASTWFREGPLPEYVTTLDVTPAFCDPAHPGVWRTSDWTGALAQPITHGETHAVVTGASPPTIGDVLVVESDAPEMEVKNIHEVSGSGPWTVGLVSPFAKDHAANARVALAYTSDGAHPSAALHKAAAAIIESYKAKGTLP
jgi:hypothetical protein